MSRFSYPTFSLMAVFILACAALAGGCKGEDPVAPSTKLTDDDAAALIAMAYGQMGGFQLSLANAVDVARGGQVTGRQKERGSVILRDTSIARTATVTYNGKQYSYTSAVNYGYFYTSNGFNNRRDYWFAGNTELVFNAGMKGTITLPKVVAVDSGWATMFLNGTDTDEFTLSGKFGRMGRYTFPGTSKIYNGNITSANMPGVKINRLTRVMDDSNLGIQVDLRGVDADSARVDFTGLLIMRPGQTPRLNLGGKTYNLDLEHGEAILQ
jgi:hypothetical protein